MKRELAIEFSRVTEAAALAGYKWLGRGDKNAADGAAVQAMRIMLNQVDINGQIVIGEGEIDKALMPYIGEQVGTGVGDEVDIAVDPIEGTRMTAMGQANALAVLAVGEKDTFLHAPDMYMEKLIVGPQAKGAINLALLLADNLRNITIKIGKPLQQFTVITLAKPRHDGVIAEMQQLGVKVFVIPDGDVAASILTCMPDSEVDVLYGIGGAPEGVISAAVIRALDGDMQGRLLARHQVKGDSEENRRLGDRELKRCAEMGIEAGRVLTLSDMARNDNVIFSATGITKGDLLEGIARRGNIATTETLLIRGKSRTIRRIRSTHYLDRKDPALHDFLL
ncbi:fructose-bisphosphatase class II [Candidatus Symbiopectobacterium sp. 'North America']|uniref:class II fructose-bisphosphatase n=1 Tax=Candidatus Symbiopectobacterium sp. 'North America' TaxID=2794574 RepID=UPI0018CA1827|nr:class II fructose-bisphosphatase [Candidatus Symbiopectobacterium sp. 'North America']MBG6245433.1 fructose-bisphosphatase class II [Candidatus Symbiopectobacterium sp. 'North America']